MNVTQKLIAAHLVDGQMKPGEEIGLRIDQTLTQDATGTMVMLELEAMHADRVKTELSVQYVDHNLLQEDFKNPDDQLFLQSACQRFGIWFSRAGNGVSHPLHQERFGIPGKTLLGSDSHTCAAGAIGMLASDDKLELFPLIVEQAPDAIIFADVQGVIRVWNNAAMDIFGYRSDEAMGRSLDIIIPAHLRNAHWDGFRGAVATGHTKHERNALKTRASHKAGQELYVSLAFSVVKDRAGKAIGAIARICRYLTTLSSKTAPSFTSPGLARKHFWEPRPPMN